MIPDPEDVFACCYECGRLQAGRVLRRGETAFPLRCASCDDPSEDLFELSITALVAVAVSRSGDGEESRVRVLNEDDVRRARAASQWIAMAFCPGCGRFQEGCETAELGRFSETHLPARCPNCDQHIEAIVLEPAIVSRSHDDDEWYVVVLESEEIEQVRAGVSLAGLDRPS